MRKHLARVHRAVRRSLDRIRWRGRVRTVLRGPGAGLLLHTTSSSANYPEGTNELPVQRALAEVLHPGDNFVDVGANTGFFTLLAARLVGPGGRVVAFEAVEDIARCAQDNATLNGFDWVEVHAVAVGEAAGRAVLWVTEHPGGATLAGEADPAEVTARVEVDVVSIAELVQQGAIGLPDVIKIDVEGHELPVLEGAAPLFCTHRPTIIVELDAATPSELQIKRTETRGWLRGHGYSVEELAPSYAGTDWQVTHLCATADQPSSA